jgi:hypothetical protein
MAWLYGYPNVITGCLKVYAIKIAVWREQVLDGLKVMKFCLDAHGIVALTLIWRRYIDTCAQLHSESISKGRVSATTEQMQQTTSSHALEITIHSVQWPLASSRDNHQVQDKARLRQSAVALGYVLLRLQHRLASDPALCQKPYPGLCVC